MDNGLIFPYPHTRAHDEPHRTNHPYAGDLRVEGVWLGPWWVVVERWGDAGR